MWGIGDTLTAGADLQAHVRSSDDTVTAGDGSVADINNGNSQANVTKDSVSVGNFGTVLDYGTLDVVSALSNSTINQYGLDETAAGGASTQGWEAGSGDTLTAGISSTITEVGNTDTATVSNNATITAIGSSDTLDLEGSNDLGNGTSGDTVNVSGTAAAYISGGTIGLTAGASVNLSGNSDTVVLGGTGDYLGLQGSTGDQVTAVESTIDTTGGSSLNLWGYDDTVGLGGTGDYLGLEGSTGDQVTAVQSTIDTTAGSSLNLWGYDDTVGLGGTGDYLGLEGSGGDQVTAVHSTIDTTAGSSLNLWGYDDAIGLGGTGDYLGLEGSGGDQVTAAGDTIDATSGSSLNLWGYDDTIALTGTSEFLGLQGSTGDQVTASGDTIDATTGSSLSLTGNGDTTTLDGDSVTATIVGSSDLVDANGANDVANLNWGTVNLDGNNQSVTINGSQDVANSVSSGDTVGFNGTNETANISNGTVNLDGDNQNVTINGSGDLGQSIWSGDTIGFNGTNENTNISDGTVNLDGDGQEVTVTGNDNLVGSAWSGNVVGFAGTSDTAQIDFGLVYLDTPSTTVTVEGSGDTANSQFSGNTVGFTGRGDTAQITNGTIITDDTSGGVEIVGSGDTVNAVSGGTQSAPVLDDPTVSDIDALYNMVLERDPSSAELIGAQTELATGAGLDGLMGTLANSVEAQADMTSTFEAASGAYQSLMTAQPQSNEEQSVSGIDPTQAEFNAFADVMSTSYGAPIEIVSFDPNTGAQTELADTSATNLLAELPVLETEANGVNLGLKLADGTELQFASTARLTTFLYSVAVQQMQATQFVTDNYNLDMQWLNTIDQPLLQEAVFWSEAAAYFQPFDKVRAEELNIESSLALKIAGESPGSRQDLEQTINNPDTGNPTQITVYAAADGSRVHDVSGGIGGILEGVFSAIVNVAAAFFPETGLPFLAAALDAAQAGQAFSNGEDIEGILNLAQALGFGANGFSDSSVGKVISLAAQGAGGVYGVVESAENGNAAGIIAGALEAAAAVASGVALDSDGETQATLNALASAFGTAGVATSFASALASGNLGEGLVDSLNLFLPAVAQAYANYQTTLTYVDDGAWDTPEETTGNPNWANNATPGSGLSPAELASLNNPTSGTAPINSVTLLAPTGLWFSEGDGPEALAVPINNLNLPGFSHPGAQNLTAAPGFFGVAGDGNPMSIIGPNGTPMNAPQLAALIQSSGWQPGQPIQLFACFTGAPTPDGSPDIALQLANILHTEVIAPSTFGWVSSNGSFQIAPANDPTLDYNSPAAAINASQPSKSIGGFWVAFNAPDSLMTDKLLNFPAGGGNVLIKTTLVGH